MYLDQTEEQSAVLQAISAILARADRTFGALETSSFDATLDAELAANGMFDCASELGLPTAALVVQEICSAPSIVEVAASSLLRPIVGPEAPRPLAVVHGDGRAAVRFLPIARAVLFLSEGRSSWCEITPDDVERLDSYFAYPMGRLRDPAGCLARSVPCADAERLNLVATAAEIAGVLQGGLASVIEHVRERRQFGRPIGSFQAVQHRLAAASARIAAARWLTLAAADGDRAAALCAVGYAQDSIDPIVYDLHQFMGALGLTLEHPLHRWSYRAKLLKSDLGGASRHYRSLAEATWGA